MKHSSQLMVTALAWAIASPARAQQTPPNPPAPPQATPPSAPQPAPPAPAPTQPGTPGAPPPATTATPSPAPTAPAPAPPVAQPSPDAPPAPNTPAADAPAQPAAVAPPAAPAAPAAAPGVADPALAARDARRAPVNPKKEPEPRERPLLGLALGTPDTGALPGRFRPSYGVAKSVSDWRFDFHGYLNVPLRFGVNERKDPNEYQYESVLHGPPIVPDDYGRFEHTGVIPEPWVQLGFSYGNSVAVATVIIAAKSVSNASGFFNPPTQLGINDAFITFKPDFGGNAVVDIDVGAFANRYGSTGEYDTGRYDMPVIARVSGVGETARASVPISKELVFLAEQGIMGQWDRAPLGVDPAGWNDFADTNVGTSFAHHEHLGLAVPKLLQFGVHYINAWTRDDRTAPEQRDGGIHVFGADVSVQRPPFGRFYLGGSYVSADDARGVSGVIRVLNSFGGPGLMREYLGPNSRGTGNLTIAGAQYDVSIGEIVRSPSPYSGYGPDVFASVFGLFTHVGSEDADYDGVDKVKYGAELTYSALSWLAVSGRYDRVVADTSDDSKTFAILSPRLIFRTDFNSQDQVTLQYSRWFYGSGVNARVGYPPVDAPYLEPDADTITLTASMWW